MAIQWAEGARPWSIIEEFQWAIREELWGIVRGYFERGWDMHTSLSSEAEESEPPGKMSLRVVVAATDDPSWGECTHLALEVTWVPEPGLDDVFVPIPMSVTSAWLNLDAGADDALRPLARLRLPPELGCELAWVLARGVAYEVARQWELRWHTPLDEFDRRIAELKGKIARSHSDRGRRWLHEAVIGMRRLRAAARFQQSSRTG